MGDETGRVTTRSVLRSRGALLMRVGVVYQLLTTLLVTPLVTAAGSLAIAGTGSQVVVNSNLTRLATSPLSLLALAVAAIVLVAASAVHAAASGIAVVDGGEAADAPFSAALRELRELLGVAGWVARRASGWVAVPVVLAGAAYLVLIGPRDVVSAFARNQSALVGIGVGLGAALLAEWFVLGTRWVFAYPVFVAEGLRGRAALDRSWELTSRGWFGLGAKLVALMLVLAIPGGVAIGVVNSLAVSVGTGGHTVVLAGLLSLSALLTFGSTVAIAVCVQAFCLARYLTVGGRPVPPARVAAHRRWGWVPVAAVLAVALATGGLGALAGSVLLLEPLDASRIELIAHRAGEAYAPENTVAAVKQARADGVSRIEFDVQRTADGKLVVVHDADLLRLSGRDVSIARSTLAQVQSVDIGAGFGTRFAGEHVPTLEAFLDAAGTTPLALEIKTHAGDRDTTREVVALLTRRGAIARTVLISLDPDLTALAHAVNPALKTGDLVSLAAGEAYTLPSDVIAPDQGLADTVFVQSARAAGKKVWVWTVDDEDLVRVAALRGVDGIITSDVPAARQALERLGRVNPADIARQRLQDLVEVAR